jgi:hypothetical protein
VVRCLAETAVLCFGHCAVDSAEEVATSKMVSWDDDGVAPDPAKELEDLPHAQRAARVEATQVAAVVKAKKNNKKRPAVESNESSAWIDEFKAQQEAAASTNRNAGRGGVVPVAVSRTPPPQAQTATRIRTRI